MLKSFLIATSIGILSFPIFAQNFVVKNVPEFRQALEDSALNGQDDIISLKPGVYKTNSDGLGTFKFFDDERQSLTIKADKIDNDVILDGSSLDQVLRVTGTGRSKLFIKDITIRNGKSGNGEFGGDGGGLYTTVDADIINCIFYNNIALGGLGGFIGGAGGAIYAHSWKTTIINSAIYDNTAGSGAGIYVSNFNGGGEGKLIVINTNFYNNKEKGNPFVDHPILHGDGSAINVATGKLLVINSNFINNDYYSISTDSNSTFINNIFLNNEFDILFDRTETSKLYNNYVSNIKLKNTDRLIKKNNISSEKQVVTFKENSFELKETSAGINAGMSGRNTLFRELTMPFVSDRASSSEENERLYFDFSLNFPHSVIDSTLIFSQEIDLGLIFRTSNVPVPAKYDAITEEVYLPAVGVESDYFEVKMKHQGDLVFKVVSAVHLLNSPQLVSSFYDSKKGVLSIKKINVNGDFFKVEMIHLGDLIFKVSSISPIN